MSKKGKKALQQIVDQSVYDFQASQSMWFCECAINLMASTMPIHEVAEYLRRQVKILEEYE